ncbi:hypothetical protein [Paenibacillus eucommiae]|uniref:Uncharacterized protein n=1 Tax=Paenibacillus eucommiae TaxID=1355755 RepID=A0ABS4IYT3_9BACL|nr:hypothetical protein [Paenibacillus eucommiae]MBP1992715.1 hypothetical protein [Paenibacillus eucommiae]
MKEIGIYNIMEQIGISPSQIEKWNWLQSKQNESDYEPDSASILQLADPSLIDAPSSHEIAF